MKQFYRPMLTTFLVALGAACLWIATQSSHHVAAAPIATPTQNTMAGMNHADSNIIDGSLHPELIPDSVAYRLFFLMASRRDPLVVPTREIAHRHGMLRAAGIITDYDTHNVDTILATFRAQYTALSNEYNATAATATSDAPQKLFLARRDQLVQFTRDQLKSNLSQQVMAAFDAHIQQEKSMMKAGKDDR